MKIETVAVIAPGEMGHAVGQRLIEGGLSVVTCLEGRSERSRSLAEKAGIPDLGRDRAMLEAADIVLSILPPSSAVDFARRMAETARDMDAPPPLADLNAISPGTAREAERIVAEAGMGFVDGGIVGGPPFPGRRSPRIYVSGDLGEDLGALTEAGLNIKPLTGGVGAASAIKLSYACLTKGLSALTVQAMAISNANGTGEAFFEELRFSQAELLAWLENMVPAMPPKAYRWIGEMEEISKAIGKAGLPPTMFEGTARLYERIEATRLAQETPETRDKDRSLQLIGQLLSEDLAS